MILKSFYQKSKIENLMSPKMGLFFIKKLTTFDLNQIFSHENKDLHQRFINFKHFTFFKLMCTRK